MVELNMVPGVEPLRHDDNYTTSRFSECSSADAMLWNTKQFTNSVAIEFGRKYFRKLEEVEASVGFVRNRLTS